MKVDEFGKENVKSFVMFQCAAEPWWVFKASAAEMAKDYHVYLMIADGHDALGTEFVSLEKYAKDAAVYLKTQGIDRIDAMYGVSMGGAAVIRFLATEDIPVERAIIDAGITPYPYPRLICRLISVKDWIMVMLGTRSLRLMKLAYPPERWTPEGQEPEEHYRALLRFYQQHELRTRKTGRLGFSHLPDIVPEKAVDLGCGAGRNVGELLKKYPKAHVTGMDYSDLSVEKSKDYNKASIEAGRCEVVQGDVSDLKLPADAKDMR